MPVNVGAVRVPQFGGRVMVTATGQASLTTFDSGLQFMDAMDYPRFVFQLLGTFTGMSAQFYGSNDPAIYAFYLANIGNWQGVGLNVTQNGVTTPPATSWVNLPAPSEQSGSSVVNPITTAGQLFETRIPVLAVRCVITAAAGSTGTCQAIGMATV